MPRDKRPFEAETLDGQDAYAAAGIPMRRTDVRDLTGAGH